MKELQAFSLYASQLRVLMVNAAKLALLTATATAPYVLPYPPDHTLYLNLLTLLRGRRMHQTTKLAARPAYEALLRQSTDRVLAIFGEPHNHSQFSLTFESQVLNWTAKQAAQDLSALTAKTFL